MATVSFSVPDDVKTAFDKAFKYTNKSVVIADLMRRAITGLEMKKQRMELFTRLTEQRSKRPSATGNEVKAIKRDSRK